MQRSARTEKSQGGLGADTESVGSQESGEDSVSRRRVWPREGRPEVRVTLDLARLL